MVAGGPHGSLDIARADWPGLARCSGWTVGSKVAWRFGRDAGGRRRAPRPRRRPRTRRRRWRATRWPPRPPTSGAPTRRGGRSRWTAWLWPRTAACDADLQRLRLATEAVAAEARLAGGRRRSGAPRRRTQTRVASSPPYSRASRRGPKVPCGARRRPDGAGLKDALRDDDGGAGQRHARRRLGAPLLRVLSGARARRIFSGGFREFSGNFRGIFAASANQTGAAKVTMSRVATA
ncbi:hypothetical protein M885DRAFT_341789 [Pelagophyceae sp. CCMP2097]|nr:hypothetical protein M885DRAFT_341789 [Pelagophyceae sp. CCMP2097]